MAMEDHEGPWMAMKGQGDSAYRHQDNDEDNRIPWRAIGAMEGHGGPWNTIESHRIPIRPLNTIEGHKRSWRAIESHGGPWRAM